MSEPSHPCKGITEMQRVFNDDETLSSIKIRRIFPQNATGATLSCVSFFFKKNSLLPPFICVITLSCPVLYILILFRKPYCLIFALLTLYWRHSYPEKVYLETELKYMTIF